MYIEQAYKGLHEGWRYVLGVVAVFFGWQLIGAIPLMSALVIKNGIGSIATTPNGMAKACLLYTSPSPRDRTRSRMPSSA